MQRHSGLTNNRQQLNAAVDVEISEISSFEVHLRTLNELLLYIY